MLLPLTFRAGIYDPTGEFIDIWYPDGHAVSFYRVEGKCFDVDLFSVSHERTVHHKDVGKR